MTYGVDWDAVHPYVRRVLRGKYGYLPILGTAEWQALADSDPAKVASIIVAGDRWALETDLLERSERRAALKDASIEASQELDWARVAKHIADRDAFYRQHPDLRRKTA
ncbi:MULTISPECIES: DUF2742 domain-containing protein [Gordonia]|uniref:DUF2742 domain-containing protein n=1 Tax=Gordonia sihwensis NBRC 108236 TaxID=1223544 RepID=L7LFK9_9ACTN|nr:MULTISPECIES: DUF2742 domain-containing protein [Gordonia]GAC59501.1 hypothetical protein GSI01S_02_01440 [Gordonia sihwensis NBRC 108236]